MSKSEEEGGVYIFGYGSLIWRTVFEYEHKVVGYISGYKRRFWMGSSDHRGVPGSPGRVVTLVKSDSHSTHPSESNYPADQVSRTWGIAVYVKKDLVEETLEYLDERETGYARLTVPLWNIVDGKEQQVLKEVIFYFGPEDVEEFLGPAELHEIAEQIVQSVGMSGTNIEYLLNLSKALETLSIEDKHITDLVHLVNDKIAELEQNKLEN